MDDIQQLFLSRLAEVGIVLREPERQLAQFERYYALLVEWNEKMNLTGITERSAVYEKHFYDSLTVACAAGFDGRGSLADIGSGAGFPSIPLKIAYPQLEITIVDALAKRIRFLETVADELGLSGVSCMHGRAEEAGRQPAHRDRYDWVTARAVARLAGLCELCLPFARTGGVFIAMKGSDVQEELDESLYAIGKLNGTLRSAMELTLPGEGARRHLIVIGKTGATPKAYPRKPGLPLKDPLLQQQKV